MADSRSLRRTSVPPVRRSAIAQWLALAIIHGDDISKHLPLNLLKSKDAQEVHRRTYGPFALVSNQKLANEAPRSIEVHDGPRSQLAQSQMVSVEGSQTRGYHSMVARLTYVKLRPVFMYHDMDIPRISIRQSQQVRAADRG